MCGFLEKVFRPHNQKWFSLKPTFDFRNLVDLFGLDARNVAESAGCEGGKQAECEEEELHSTPPFAQSPKIGSFHGLSFESGM